MRASTPLAWRAALAVVLMVSFYGLALVVIGLLLGTAVLLVRLSLGLAKFGLFLLVGAFLIFKAILPRRDRFEPPGPRLDPEHQPRLFAEIRDVARKVGQEEPTEVYLVPDVNAWVGHRGGLMGFGSRRVMGLGLPLLQILTIPELRAVLAHEFGHLHGGDVAIGPWVYKTRAAIVRTILELHQHSKAMTKPFEWYAELFFRVSHKVSRHQEVQADSLARDVTDAESLASGLRITHGAALAFLPYWKGAVEPVLSSGFVPPLAAGFETFLGTPWVAGKIKESLTEAALRAAQTPYDTHPPLPDRLSALGVDPSSTERKPGPSALSLLDDLPALETRLVEIATRRAAAKPSENDLSLNLRPDPQPLMPVAWNEVGTRVWLPRWEGFVRQSGKVLAGVTPASLPDLDWKRIGRKLLGRREDADPLQVADFAVGAALALALSRAGFTVECPPGSPPTLVCEADRIEVFNVREVLAQGPEAVHAWRTFCERTGIASADLGAASVGSGSSPAIDQR